MVGFEEYCCCTVFRIFETADGLPLRVPFPLCGILTLQSEPLPCLLFVLYVHQHFFFTLAKQLATEFELDFKQEYK